MLQGWVVIAVALAYIGLLFLVASYGDRTRKLGRKGRARLIYPLSLAIYCTSWTFFGSVGSASRTGYEFLTIYIGPVLMLGLFSPLIVRIVRLAKAQNITSIADFIAARYGKAQPVAALVALIAIMGSIPYIALQLKAVSASLETILAHVDPGSHITNPVLGDISLFVALSMATFAVLFGTRHIDATEHQDGLMLAIASESIIKLFAFLAVGIYVTFWMFGGPGALLEAARTQDWSTKLFTREPPLDTFIATTMLSFFAIILLPRQFHVAVVENNSESEIKRAAWLFPLYLVLINVFVIPIAFAGLLTFAPGEIDSDMFVLGLPLLNGSSVMTIAAFVGGLSAATAMVIVESVALSIMVSNDIVMPLVLQRREGLISGRGNVGSLLLTVRRIAIFAILLLAYLYYRTAGDAQLASIGLLSFAAIAQLAPAFFGGLFWRRATAGGAIAGMTAGILVWAYTLLLPSFADIGIVGQHILTDGPWHIVALRPQNLFGIELPPLVHGVLWSLAVNLACYIGFSLRHEPSSIERLQANVFVPSDLAPIAQRLLYIEQPMPRDITRTSPLGALSRRDVIIDEADDSYDAFPQAKSLGYRGISSKSCKGIYKAMLNAARAAKWSGAGERFFVSGEDLTCQAGLAVQQDLALGAFIGVTHAERNGHHYVDGFEGAPVSEARAFLAAHPDLYSGSGATVRLAFHDGDLLTGSLVTAGFASGVHPDWAALKPLDVPTTRIAQEQAI